MKQIIICADDYGQNKEISQGIIELIQQKRLSATSCLTTSAYWPTAALALSSLKEHIDTGLHFNLTEGKPLSNALSDFSAVNRLIIRSQFRALDSKAITVELNAQLDSFIDHMGHAPDFIDGHQHIHQFPVIRDALLDVYEKRLNPSTTFLRSTYQALMPFKEIHLKQLIINLCGGFKFRKLLDERNIPHNTSFSGVYDFSQVKDYPQLFVSFLKASTDKGIVMCHPGKPSYDKNDPIAESRSLEMKFLLSDAFLFALEESDIAISRFNENVI